MSARLLNLVLAACLAGYATLSWAGSTLAQDMRATDFESIVWAGAAGLLGGIFRTVLTLASKRVAVWRVPPEAKFDAVVAVIAGIAAYFVVQGVSSGIQAYWNAAGVPRDLRQLVVVGAGWLGLGFFSRLDRLGTVAVGGFEKRLNNGEAPPAEVVAVVQAAEPGAAP